MKNENLNLSYRKAIAEALVSDPENIFLFWKGRVALYALLKSMGVGEGDEVIMPGFTCVVVPNACLYLGAKPVYVDIDRSTLNMDPALIEKKITSRTKVILAQNTFGLSPDIEAILTIANKHSLSVIEDCTHGFGGFYNGRPNGTNSIASFYSTQWNKPFSTGVGGFAWTNDSAIRSKMKDLEQSLVSPSFTENNLLALLIRIRKLIENSSVYWSAIKLYRKLSNVSGFIGSSSEEELSDVIMPDDYLKGASEVQCSNGLKELKKVNEHILHRQKIAGIYSSYLGSLGITPIVNPVYTEHTFLKYPVLVSDRELFLRLAMAENIEIGDWFLSPIHPILSNWEKWKYERGSCPNAEYVSSHVINLPTHRGISEKKAESVVQFLTRHKELLIIS